MLSWPARGPAAAQALRPAPLLPPAGSRQACGGPCAMLRKSLWPALIVTGALLLAAIRLSPTYTLAGTVTDAETGAPVAGAAVTAAGRQATSGAQGEFALPGLRGLPLVQVVAPGYRRSRSPWLLAGLSPLAGLPGVRRGLLLRLAPTELGGRVIDAATRAPVAGATVRAGEVEAKAGADGRYRLRRVRQGAEIRASARYYGDSEAVAYTGQATQEIALSLLPATVAVQDACSGQALPGASLRLAGDVLPCDGSGRVAITRLEPGTAVEAACAGYDAARGAASPGETLVLGLRPALLRATVAATDGRPLAGALVVASAPGLEPSLTRTGADGSCSLECAPPGATLAVRLAGYRRLERRLGAERQVSLRLEPFAARGIYLASHMLNPLFSAQLQANLSLLGRGQLNAVVLEIKTEGGHVCFQPELPLAREIGAGLDGVIDVRALVQSLKARGIYTIARMAVFEDDLLGSRRPEWAVHRPDGSPWRAAGGRVWTDAFRREVWDYNIALAREVVGLGFDEIQFDYVRFPSDGAVSACVYSCQSTPESRVQAIAGFLAQARQALDETGAFLSADVFGLTTFADDEAGIGQLLQAVGPHLDYVSPMVYPSTYAPGMVGVADPWRSPYEVVKRSLAAARQRTSTPIRPWLQAYDDYNGTGYVYGLRELRLQVQAAVEEQSAGWLFWNAPGQYDPRLAEP